MDKETLSNYGWIVILVLILAVMLALATPFGNFIAGAIKSTTAGLFDVNQGALGAAGIIIPGQDFQDTSVDNTNDANTPAYDHNAPELHPDDGITVWTGYTYDHGDYQYVYNCYYNGSSWTPDETQNGWGVRVISTYKTTYGPILESIHGEPVVSIARTFQDCANMTEAPVMPNSATDMIQAFKGCSALTTAPKIPNGVTEIRFAFYECASLNTYHGSTSAIGDFSGYIIPNSVTSTRSAFYKCTSLAVAPRTPSSVTDAGGTFFGCSSLTGTVSIPCTAETDAMTNYGTSATLEIYHYEGCGH